MGIQDIQCVTTKSITMPQTYVDYPTNMNFIDATTELSPDGRKYNMVTIHMVVSVLTNMTNNLGSMESTGK